MTNLTVTSAMELSMDIRKEIEEKFSGMLRDTVCAEYLIDEKLLGGIVVFDGTRVYDGSVRTKLENLREKIYE
ncbi:MAG: F0F1 ATP synthase subunit delta [Clostridia bacterium]|nr:F0F1 ATP synthase subunit delta [Clostridia bacterium]